MKRKLLLICCVLGALLLSNTTFAQTLSALTLSSGTLSPAFSSTTYSYTSFVTTPSLTVTSTSPQVNAAIYLKVNNGIRTLVGNGSASTLLLLNEGDNTIQVEVYIAIQGGGLPTIYTINVRTPSTLDIVGLSNATPATTAYSLRKLASNYTGNAINVRRSSDDATLDIGFNANGGLDTVALKTFVGTGDGFATRWYDQSGYANDVYQTDASLQPKIVTAGTVNRLNKQPAIYFGTANLATDKKVLFPDATSMVGFAKGNNAVASSFVSKTGYSDDTQNNMPAPFDFTNEDGEFYVGDIATGQLGVVYLSYAYPRADISEDVPASVYSFVVPNNSTANFYAYRNGVETRNYPVGGYQDYGNNLRIGNRNDGESRGNFWTTELILFNSVLSQTDRQLVENSQINFYNNSDANLSALVASTGALSPVFDSATTYYTTAVANSTNTLTLTPTLSSANAMIEVKVNGGGSTTLTSGSVSTPLAVNYGNNNISLKITAQDGTIKIYKITVYRTPLAPTISSFSPTTASVGSLIAITGTNLIDPLSLTIGGVSAIPLSSDGSIILAMVMPGTASGSTISFSSGTGTVTSTQTLTIAPKPAPNMQQGLKLVGTGNIGKALQGRSLAISSDGNTALVGGPNDNSNKGAVWVYTRLNGVWSQQGGKLVGTGNIGGGQQGFSVSLSADGNTAIVGAPFDNSLDGAAWVYIRVGGVWTQQGNKLVGTGGSGPYQGTSVSLSADGNTAIVGGEGDVGSRGAAWIFTRENGEWSQQGAKLTGNDAEGFASRQGFAVSISKDGNTAIVGGYLDNSEKGAAWIYTRNAGVWTQQGSKLVGSGSVGKSRQGFSVSLNADGNTAMIGGYWDDTRKGAAWVFTRTSGVWNQQGAKLIGTTLLGPNEPGQGSSVSLSADGNTAMVGGWYDNAAIGASWVYVRRNGQWTQRGVKLVATDAENFANQGYAVALSADGSTGMMGGFSNQNDIGAAWAFTGVAGTNADLASLTLSNGMLAPAFAAATTSYTTTVTTANVTVIPTQADVTASTQIQVNNGVYANVSSGLASSALPLNIGSNTINVKVTAEDGTTTKTYTIPVTREKEDQVITFPALSGKNTTSPDFEPGATTNSGLALTYTSSNPLVATAYQDNTDGDKWKIHIQGEGTTDIIAAQAGDANYNSASVSRELIVANVLPVELINYQAKIQNSSEVLLSWVTLSELNNAGFEIWKSTDGKSFEKLTFIKGAESSATKQTYTYVDLSPNKGDNYYKLIQLDKDGVAKEVGLKTVRFEIGKTDLVSVYPNPTSNLINVDFEASKFTDISISDVSGKVILKRKISSTESKVSLNVEKLPTASYIIKLQGANGSVAKTFIKL